MWQPNNEYKPKQQWEDHEDKALMACWGLTSLEEIAEAFMCSCYNIMTRARILGLIPSRCNLLSAKQIEDMVRLFDDNKTMDEVTAIYNLPNEIYRYKTVTPSCDRIASRELQDYHARNNENQLDMFGVAEGDNE